MKLDCEVKMIMNSEKKNRDTGENKWRRLKYNTMSRREELRTN
jgi:hypothetical protein